MHPFTQKQWEQYNTIEQLIERNEWDAVVEALVVHSQAPPEFRHNVVKMLVESQNIPLIQHAFPHLDWILDCLHYDSVLAANNQAIAEEFFKYVPTRFDEYNLIHKCIECKSHNILPLFLTPALPVSFAKSILFAFYRNECYEEVCQTLNYLKTQAQSSDTTEDIYKILMLFANQTITGKRSFVDEISEIVPNHLLSHIIVNASRHAMDPVVFQSISAYADKCTTIGFFNKVDNVLTDDVFIQLLKAAFQHNDLKFLNSFLSKSTKQLELKHILIDFGKSPLLMNALIMYAPVNKIADMLYRAIDAEEYRVATLLYDRLMLLYPQNKQFIDNNLKSDPNGEQFIVILEQRSLNYALANEQFMAPTSKRKL